MMTDVHQRLRERGPIRVTLPAAVAYDPDALKKTLGGILDRIGCNACCSGADILLQMEREFVADEAANLRHRELGPQPDPWVGARHQYTIAMSSGMSYDIDKVFAAIDKVNVVLGGHPCTSGYDFLLKNELRTISVSAELDVQKLDAAF